MNFEEFKQEILERAKKANACKGQYQRAAEATTIDELIEVLKDNINFARNNDILTIELSKQYERPELFNVGKENAGFFNSGDLNSGYRNSGVFSTKKRTDTVPFFNKESEMTWDEWYDHRAYDITRGLQITEWIDWDSMNEDEKKEYPKAFVTGGRLKVYEYKQAWANLWGTLSDREKEIVKSLPNFDNEVFLEITGLTL